MRRHTGFLVVVLFVAAAVPVAVRQAPDLSGTWVATKDAPATVAAAPTPVFGERFAIRQSGESVTVVRPVRDTTVTLPFVLDGREVRVRIPGGLCLGDSETIETAKREGDGIAFVITGFVPAGGGAAIKRDIRRVFKLQDRDTLVVEAGLTVQGQFRPVATVYKRSSDPLAESTAAVVPNRASGTIAQAAWLSGTWSGTAKETTIEERWTPPSGGSMLSIGRTMRNGLMGSFEFLCIVERNGGLVYSAMPNGRSPATHFTATAITPDSITFENPAHDFPKMIRYTRKPDGSLETVVSGAGGQRAETAVLHKQQ